MNIEAKTKKILNTVFNITVSLMLAVSGVLFAVSCYLVYISEKKQMFTYESIGRAFDKIDIFVYITIAFVVAGAIIKFVFPKSEEKIKVPRRVKSLCIKLGKRADINGADECDRNKVISERKLRRALRISGVVIGVLEALLPLIYLLNPNTFPANNGEYNSEILHGMLLYLCMLAPLAIYGTVYYILTRRSYVREADILKKLPKKNLKECAETAPDGKISKFLKFCKDNEKPLILGARLAFLGCAFVFIVLGILNGGMRDVLIKAVNICAECIGLG